MVTFYGLQLKYMCYLTLQIQLYILQSLNKGVTSCQLLLFPSVSRCQLVCEMHSALKQQAFLSVSLTGTSDRLFLSLHCSWSTVFTPYWKFEPDTWTCDRQTMSPQNQQVVCWSMTYFLFCSSPLKHSLYFAGNEIYLLHVRSHGYAHCAAFR